MRYFHRTSVSPDDVLENADKHFVSMGTVAESGSRNRVYKGAVETDRECKGEADKVAQGFFKSLHSKAHAAHG